MALLLNIFLNIPSSGCLRNRNHQQSCPPLVREAWVCAWQTLVSLLSQWSWCLKIEIMVEIKNKVMMIWCPPLLIMNIFLTWHMVTLHTAFLAFTMILQHWCSFKTFSFNCKNANIYKMVAMQNGCYGEWLLSKIAVKLCRTLPSAELDDREKLLGYTLYKNRFLEFLRYYFPWVCLFSVHKWLAHINNTTCTTIFFSKVTEQLHSKSFLILHMNKNITTAAALLCQDLSIFSYFYFTGFTIIHCEQG